MATYGVVYRITCLTNGKRYHGQTINPKERRSHHFQKGSHCHALVGAINKYGRNNFTFEVVAEASSKEELDSLEQKYVATSMSPMGYNLVEGGANGRPSEETRRKISLSGKIAQNRPEVKARNSKNVRCAMARSDVKERHRLAVKEATSHPEARRKARDRMLKVHARPGETEARGVSIKNSWATLTEEARNERLQAQREGYTAEVRAKISRTSTANLARPDTKRRHRDAVRASWTPERRDAMRQHSTAAWAKPGAAEKRGAAISQSHNTPEGKAKLARRRRRGESEETWQLRVKRMSEGDP